MQRKPHIFVSEATDSVYCRCNLAWGDGKAATLPRQISARVMVNRQERVAGTFLERRPF